MKPQLKKVLKWLRRSRKDPQSLITVEISRSALLSNLGKFRELTGNRAVAPVLKSNAYGHGLIEVANILKDELVPFFIIDSYFEVRHLRNEGIRTPLLVIGYSSTETVLKNRLKDVSFTITSIEALKDLSEKARTRVSIHLKIDTGMHRQGILTEEVNQAKEVIKNNQNIYLEGICSHFADADNIDRSFTDKQVEKWNTLVEYFRSTFTDIKHWHVSNTHGHLYKKAEANMTRLGIGLYGLAEIEGLDLKPALEMKTTITSVKKMKAGESVGYGGTFVATKDMIVATIPTGYYEGVDRRLSNKGFVKIGDVFCPIVGRVSMNITSIDVSRVSQIKIGDEVMVISRDREDKNSILNIAKVCDTITYVIAVHIAQHLRRVLVE